MRVKIGTAAFVDYGPVRLLEERFAHDARSAFVNSAKSSAKRSGADIVVVRQMDLYQARTIKVSATRVQMVERRWAMTDR